MVSNKSENRNGLEIAVVGMSCKFPGAKDVNQFWENLNNEKETISFFTDEELLQENIDFELIKNPNFVKAKGIVEDVEYFDEAFFGYSPKEAKIMDPQIRIFHECAWNAMEDAGYDLNSCDHSIGLYVGASSNFNWVLSAFQNGVETDSQGLEAGILSYKDSISTLTSYKLNLGGPSITVYTACSTSLVSIHLACRGLLTGDCSMAMAGGVSVSYPKKNGYIYQQGMIKSFDGHCRSFDEKADGTVFGDGVGVVVLKRLDDAIADGDNIYAVIKASVVNNDAANRAGYTAPSVEGQAEVIRNALYLSEVEKESIGYIEAHGTATSIGDPIEIEALKKVFGASKNKYCRIGTVKTNLGHLDAAAGVAGFIKTVLSIKHKTIVPNLNFDKINPRIVLDKSPFEICSKKFKWENEKYPLRAGVSSFGLGGTNAHVILEEAPELSIKGDQEKNNLLVFSAKSQTALDKIINNTIEFLEKEPEINLSNMAYTLQVGRSKFSYRRAIICSSVEEAIYKLKEVNNKSALLSKVNQKEKSIIFMFSGQGSQYVNMGKELYNTEHVFRENMEKCFNIYYDTTKERIENILYPIENIELANIQINRTDITQPILFMYEYSLAKLLISWGIKPGLMIGYSFGEYVAACLSNVISLKDAIQLVVVRGKLMKKIPRGAMLSIPLKESEVKEILNEDISLAVDNGDSCIVSGSIEAIEKLNNEMRNNKIICMKINSSHAGHSKLMDSILDEFGENVREIKLSAPTIPYISGITGQFVSEEDVCDYKYWIRQLRDTIRFSQGIKELAKKSNLYFIEIGPGRDLSVMAKRFINSKKYQFVFETTQNSLKKVDDIYFLYRQLGKLWENGVEIDWNILHLNKNRNKISLPTYPFDKKYYWPSKNQLQNKNKISVSGYTQVKKNKNNLEWFYEESWKQSRLNCEIVKNVKHDRNLLILSDEYEIGINLGKKFIDENYRVISIVKGEKFNKIDDFNYVINPEELNDYKTVMEELQTLELTPHKIIHMFSLNEPSVNEEFIERFKRAQNNGYYSLILLIKAINLSSFTSEINVEVITNNIYEITGEEILLPEQSTIAGLCNVIPQENLNINCRNIDIYFEKSSNINKTKIVEQLFKELKSSCSEKFISYRGNFRWIKFYEKINLNNEVKRFEPFKENNVYLITGGLGNIGLYLAECIAKIKNVNLVLINRSYLPDKNKWDEWIVEHNEDDLTAQKIKKIMCMEQLGSRVKVISADVSNEDQMIKVINDVEEELGQIKGIIHAAGIVNGNTFKSVNDIEIEDSEEHFKSKVYGILTLEKIFKNRDLDFCLLMSSVASILGGLGFAAYSSANIFIDNYIKLHNRFNKTNWISVNWDGWNVNNTKKEVSQWQTNWLETAMNKYEGFESLQNVLGYFECGNIIQSTSDLDMRVSQWVDLKTLKSNDQYSSKSTEVENYCERPDLITDYVSPRDSIEQEVVKIFEDVLGMRNIGIKDDFLELGGDSLKAITVIAFIRKKFNIEIPIKEFFTYQTAEWISNYVRSNVEENDNYVITKVEEKDYYAMSHSQKRMYILQQLEPQSTAYNETIVKEFSGVIQEEELKKNILKVIDRHEVLRTSFHVIDNSYVQKIHKKVNFNIGMISCRNDWNEIRDKIDSFIKPFDLSKAPMFRVAIIKCEEEKNIVVFDIHHIISDFESMEIFFRDLLSVNEGKTLAELTVQYKDYSEWQRKTNQVENKNELLKYWKSKFSDGVISLNLPTDYNRPKIKSYEGNSISVELNQEQTKLLREFIKGNNTLFATLFSMFNVLLYKLSGEEEIIVGIPVSERKYAELESVMGMFVNTLPIKNKIDSEINFNEFLKNVRNGLIEDLNNQECPFEEILNVVDYKRDLSRNPLFDIMFNLLNYRNGHKKQSDLNVKNMNKYRRPTAQFDINFVVKEKEKSLIFEIEYCTKLFDEETISRFLKYYMKILNSVLLNPNQKLKEIEIISIEEKNKILYEFNNTKLEYLRDKTIHQLFEKQVEKTPDNIAVIFGEKILTYKELNERSNSLARILRSKGVKADSLVAIMVERSLEMIIGIMGILKAGGAYLPISPNYPRKRIQYILEDSGSKILLSSANLVGDMEFYGGATRCNMKSIA